MIHIILLWRTILRDRVFLYLLVAAVLSFLTSIWHRTAGLEQSSLSFTLVILFLVVNGLFALITLRREPLLAYMFLTTTLILNGTLFFYYRYLQLIQVG